LSRRDIPSGDYIRGLHYIRDINRMQRVQRPPSAQGFALSFFPLLRKGQIWQLFTSFRMTLRGMMLNCVPTKTNKHFLLRQSRYP